VSAAERLRADRLLEEASQATGCDDLGEPTWQDGLERLLEGLREEAGLHDVGVEVAVADVSSHLRNRLAITAWRREHPEVAGLAVERPILIVGQPRTGTTILYDLLARDPGMRAPLTWEVDHPCPPPETATFEDDPRIELSQGALDLAEAMIPGFTTFHPMGARLGQECVRITGGDFRSMIFPTQFRLPSYNRWLLHEADLAPAYRWHRRFLQHLGSRHPAPQWLLKSPAHLWHLPELIAEYPDVLLVQTHRDPLRVISSVSALAAHLRQMSSSDGTIAEAAAGYADDILVGLDRGMAARDDGTLPADQVVDVQFTDFVADPLATIAVIYERLGRELTGEAADRMRAFLAEHPGDGGGGGTRYRFADTGLDADDLRERSRPYQERFGVPSEPVS
jgi:hypothetical protein